MTKTWNLTLMATDDHPETTVRGLTNEQAHHLLLRLMHDSPDAAREYIDEVVTPQEPDALAA